MSFKRILVFFILYAFQLLCFAQNLNITNAGDPSVAYMNVWQAAELGKAFKARYVNSGLVLDDPIVNNYIEALGKKLIAHSPAPKDPIHFFIVNSPELNAFTGPGGYVGVNTGLIGFVKNEDELAAVMSHETGHVVEGHLARMLALEKETEKPTIAAALASIAIGVFNPAAGALGLTASVAGFQQHILTYTRDDEKEADRVGISILYKSGFNPMGMPEVFQALQQNSELYPATPSFLQNHPSDSYRIADSLNRAVLFPKRQYHVDPEFYLIQARIKAETSDNLPTLAAEFNQQQYSKLSYIKTVGLYGYALVEISLQNYATAQTALNQLLQLEPKQFLFGLAQAELDQAQRNYQKAFTDLENLYKTHPKSYPIAYDFAIAAYQNSNYKMAISILEDLEFEHPNNVVIYYYLAQSEADDGNTQAALMTEAKLQMQLGGGIDAKDLLMRALRTPGKNPYARIQIEAMLKMV